jgi:dephospho-CoA kinase
VQLIGLTGGIASGKSTIARRLAELGAIHLDADQLAREVVEPGSLALTQIGDRFGAAIIATDGTLDRTALGSIVFGDPQALADLNAIVHPAVQRLTLQRIAEAGEQDPDAVVIYDVPLLVEADVSHAWDLVVVADAPAELRVRRLIELRGMTEAEARARITRQASDEDRRAIADIVLDTAGSVADTIALADELWGRIKTAGSSVSQV